MAQDIAIHRTEKPQQKPAESALGFGKFFTDHMLLADYAPASGWHDFRVVPYGPLALDPAAAVLHYGQTIFEGAKAYRGDDGAVRLFRGPRHASRFAESATRICMPPVPAADFEQALETLVRVESAWVPGGPGTALYLRPTMIATEGFLGVRPADRYTFLILASPVGNYYGKQGLAPIKLWVEKRHVRAAKGGVGAAKTGGNYAASLFASTEAKQRGYSQVLWLDAREHRFLEEAGTMNVFVRIGDELVTPPLDGTILPGITRDSVLTLAKDLGLKAVERRIGLDEVMAAHGDGLLKEVFGTGTAALIAPVGELGTEDRTMVVNGGGVGEVARRIYDELGGIQAGRIADRHGWMKRVDA